MDVWRTLQFVIQVDYLSADEYPFAMNFREKLQPYLDNLKIASHLADPKDANSLQKTLADAQALAATGELNSRAYDNTYWDVVMQYYDALMHFAQAASSMLEDKPGTDAAAIKGKALYQKLTSGKPSFSALQGRHVVDGFGTKEGHFVLRTIIGTEYVATLLLDTFTQTVTYLANENKMVTDLDGVTWQFPSGFTLFRGNTTEAPPDMVLGTCPSGKKLVPSSVPDAQGTCADCEPGLYSLSGYEDLHDKTFCDACTPGLYQDKSFSTQCDVCSPGFFSHDGQASCSACPSGSYQQNSKATNCTLCSAGYFQPKEGQLACINCDDLGNFFQESIGTTVCQSCAQNNQRYIRVLSGANRSACQCKEGAIFWCYPAVAQR
jgi:hypothetical protein